MSGRRQVLAAVILVVSVGPSVWADAQGSVASPPDRTEAWLKRSHLHPAVQKLGRGCSNLFGGWLEIPLNIEKRYAKDDTFGSLLTGTAIGALKGVVRTGVGLYETVTFFLPVPPQFAPILPTLESFDRTAPRQPRYPFE